MLENKRVMLSLWDMGFREYIYEFVVSNKRSYCKSSCLNGNRVYNVANFQTTNGRSIFHSNYLKLSGDKIYCQKEFLNNVKK